MTRSRRTTTTPPPARRRRAVVLALSVLAALLAAPSGAGAETELWTPPPGAVPDRPTYLYLESPGDWIAGGETYTYSDLETDFSVSTQGPTIGISIRGREEWGLSFAPADGSHLSVGLYDGLSRSGPGTIDFGGEGHGCNTSTGWLQVDQVTYDGDDLASLAIRFEQRCEGTDSTPLHGALAWDANAPVPPSPNPTATVPDGLWQPDPEDLPSAGNFTYVTGPHLHRRPSQPEPPDVLTFSEFHGQAVVDQGRERFLARAFPTSSPWSVDLAIYSTSRAGRLQVGHYGRLYGQGRRNPAMGGMDLSVNLSTCSSEVDGWFAVDELTRVGDRLNHIRFRFERTCEYETTEGGVALGIVRGVVDWTADPVLRGIAPGSGPRRGGTVALVHGDDLVGVTEVTVGGVSVPFDRDSDGMLRVVVPALALGQHDVVVHLGDRIVTGDHLSGFTSTPNPPVASTGLAASTGDRSVTLSWAPPVDLGDEPARGIELHVVDPAHPSTIVRALWLDPEATTAELTDLGPWTTLRAQVRYSSRAGAGPWSDPGVDFAVPPPDVTPFVETPAFVDQQYRDFAGRAPSAGERNLTSAVIDLGLASPAAWAGSMRNRTEWGAPRGQVVRLYDTYFHRLPTAAELDSWSAALRKGTPLATVSANLARSTDYRARYAGLTDAQFVDEAYLDILGRSASATGRAGWLNKLAGGARRSAVLAGFSESAEHTRNTSGTVDTVLLYAGLLRRLPTGAELPEPVASSPTRALIVAPIDADALARELLHSRAYAGRLTPRRPAFGSARPR